MTQTETYTPNAGRIEKLMALARGEPFWQRVEQLQATQKENYRQARALIGTNRVGYLDRFIAIDRSRGDN